MLTVLIETRNSEEELARTLGSLISGAVEGVVRDVIVCDHGSTDQTHRVADHAGCHFMKDGVAAAISRAKAEWLLLLEPGARLSDGWMQPVLQHVSKQTMPARFRLAKAGRAPLLRRIFSRGSSLAPGLLISRRQAASLARNARDAGSLARGLAMRTLAAEIFPASR